MTDTTTKFDPAIAYRILSEKQERLHLQAGNMTWEAIYGRVTGAHNHEEESRMLRVADKLRDDAARMHGVLSYLHHRIKEEESS